MAKRRGRSLKDIEQWSVRVFNAARERGQEERACRVIARIADTFVENIRRKNGLDTKGWYEHTPSAASLEIADRKHNGASSTHQQKTEYTRLYERTVLIGAI